MDPKSAGKVLQNLIDKKKQTKAEEDKARAFQNDQDRKTIIQSVQKDFGTVITPYIQQIQKNSELSQAQLQKVLTESIAKSVKIQSPEIDTSKMEQILEERLSNLNLPTPQFHVAPPIIPEFPKIPAPIVNIPDFPTEMGIKTKTPIPVIITGPDGKPYFPGGMVGGNNNRSWMGIRGILTPNGDSMVDEANDALKVNIVAGSASGSFDYASGEIGAFTLRTVQASNAVSSVAVQGTIAAILIDSDGNTYKAGGTSGSGGAVQLQDGYASLITSHNFGDFKGLDVHVNDFGSSLVASILNGDGNTLDPRDRNWVLSEILSVLQASGAVNSVNVVGPIGPGDSAVALRVLHAGDAVASVVVNSVLTSLATNLIDSSGIAYSGSNPVPVSVSGITNSVQSALIDSSGIQYSGSNPLPAGLPNQAQGSGEANANSLRIVQVTDFASSVFVSGAADSIIAWQARQTNPTPLTDGGDARPRTDDLGRGITRPIQVRDLLRTAYTTLSSGTETALKTASAGTFLDCIWMLFANTSTVAVQVDIRCTSAGNIVHSVLVPAQATVGWVPPVPWPMDSSGNAWTADMGDFTNSNVLITSLFSEEV